jgi:ATP-binding cassette, subfamily G (WHITE), member 2, SNQ2
MAPATPSYRAPRWERKARAESLNPAFPSLDVAAITLDEYRDAVSKLLRDASIPEAHFSLTWRDLSVTVPAQAEGPGTSENVFSAFSAAASAVINGCAKVAHPREEVGQGKARVLDGVSGRLDPGDTCLILGPSGAGSSLLLQSLAGRKAGTIVKTGGEVLYNGRENLGESVNMAHVVSYVGQDDVHIRELTVRDTLQFAAECKYPAFYPYVDILRRNQIALISKILGIERVLDTIVGGDGLRGCSGGERKRVTIAEMAIAPIPGVLLLDNFSKGLDSATTLSICRSIASFATRSKVVVVASMGAPGLDSYNTFSHLIVLDAGKLLYFGRRDAAESYFTGMGFVRPLTRSVPDFVATISDPAVNSEYLPRGDAAGLPLSAHALAARFAESTSGASLRSSLDISTARAALLEPEPEVPADIIRLAKQRSLQSIPHQFRTVLKRQVAILSALKVAFFINVVIKFGFGVVLGSIFWQLPDTMAGAMSRAGVIFLSTLFIALQALSTIPQLSVDKSVHVKQSAAVFYMSTPYVVSSLAYDILTHLPNTISFVVPLYMMAGMQIGSSGQRLLYAVLILWLVAVVTGLYVRSFVFMFDSADGAQAICGMLTIVLVLTSGFLKTGDKLQGYLVWIYWANPLHYAFEALMINEFTGLKLSCTSSELLPHNAAIPDVNRVCRVSTGERYLADFVDINEGTLYCLYYFCILLGFIFFLLIVAAAAVRTSKPKGFAAKGNLSSRVREDPTDSISISVVDNGAAERASPTRLTFMNMSYSVEHGTKKLLTNVSGVVPPRQMVALMGSSGAGKSTLLDVISGRKTLKKGAAQEGEVRVNGNIVGAHELAYLAGYCEQDDTHVAQCTVRESVHFAAALRLPVSVPTAEKERKVTHTLERLGLLPFSDVLVKVLGASEKKLLTMALELVAEPLVLFLDEPTSGLSVSSAMIVVAAMRSVCDSGTGIICTIHQPSQEVFSGFDRLLLLKRGGKTVYYGELARLPSYFSSRGCRHVGAEENVADWMLECIADESLDWSLIWNESEERTALDAEVAGMSGGDGEETVLEPQTAGIATQIAECISRQFWRMYRMPEYNFTRVILQLFVALVVGIMFLREIDDTQTAATLIGATAFLSIIPNNLAVQNVIPPTLATRLVFYRELASHTYSPIAHHVSLGVAEVPFTVAGTILFAAVFYFLVGFSASSFPFFLLLNILLMLFTVMLGIALAALSPTAAVAMTFANICNILFTVLSGFLIRRPSLPRWWRWTVWVNP